MALHDPISDLLARVRNAQNVNHAQTVCRSSTLAARVLSVLQSEGFIYGYEKVSIRPGVENLEIRLKYYEGMPAIKMLKRVSTPGRRVYSSVDDLRQVRNGLGVSVLSTSKGVLSDREARRLHIGGEILFEVF